MTAHQDLLSLLKGSTRIAFLTGAGVSTDSHIPDFQTVDEAWPFRESREELTSVRMLQQNRGKFWEAYRYIFGLKTSAEWKPNSFHRAVAALERAGKDVVVLTQNVDGLHGAAGSTQVLELHGSAQTVACHRHSCKYSEPLTAAHGPASRCPICRKHLRPAVVLFGETPKGLGTAKEVVLEAEVLVVAGTALEVEPVSSLPRTRELYRPGAPTVWVNRSAPPEGYAFSHSFVGELSAFSELLAAVASEEEELTLPPL